MKVKGLKGLKGFVAVLTAIALILSVLSVQSFSMDVYAATTPIEAIEITYKEPKVGDDIYEFIKNKGYCKIPEGSNYYIPRVSVFPVDNGEVKFSVDDGTFQNQQYEIRFTVYMWDDNKYSFPLESFNKSTINGYECYGASWGVDNKLEYISIRNTPGGSAIKKYNIVISDPVVGETPAKEATLEMDPADAVSGSVPLLWFEFDQDIDKVDFYWKALGYHQYYEGCDAKPMKEGETFKEGKYYYWAIDIHNRNDHVNEKYNATLDSSNNTINGEPSKNYFYEFSYFKRCGHPIMKYNVSFETNGGSAVATQSIESGKTAVKPTDPSRTGYSFGGWYTDNSFGTAYDFGKAVTSDITLYAKWENIPDTTAANGTTDTTGNNANTTNTTGNENPAATDVTNTTAYKNEWVDGKWYNSEGVSDYDGVLEWKCNSTGWWVEDSKGWYPVSQWQKIDGKWYYFTESGYMDYSEYRDGYWLGADGALVDGYYGEWKSDSKGWWFEDTSGWYPQNKWLWINGKCYYFGGDGYMVTNQYVDGCWLGADGAWS